MKKITKCGGIMTVLGLKRQNVGERIRVIRNPLRSLLMKIDTTSSYLSARKLADDKSACFTQTLLPIFNLSGHSKSFRKLT